MTRFEKGDVELNKKTLADSVVRLLNLDTGDDVEIQRDRLDPNRVMIIRHPSSEKA